MGYELTHTGKQIDDILDRSSRISNMVPAEASNENKLADKSFVINVTGELSDLETDDRTSIVNAINEIKRSGVIVPTEVGIVGGSTMKETGDYEYTFSPKPTYSTVGISSSEVTIEEI